MGRGVGGVGDAEVSRESGNPQSIGRGVVGMARGFRACTARRTAQRDVWAARRTRRHAWLVPEGGHVVVAGEAVLGADATGKWEMML